MNDAALTALLRLYRRARYLGADGPDHYLLPTDLSRHTKKSDPLKGGRGFDVTRHQVSWDSAWRSLREAAGAKLLKQLTEQAAKEGRDLTPAEQKSINRLSALRFHNLRHTFITTMAEAGTPLHVMQAQVGHMSDSVTRLYTHISSNAARAAVEKLDKMRQSSNFVDVFVDSQEAEEVAAAKLLIIGAGDGDRTRDIQLGKSAIPPSC